ncbi:undecaprenyl-diphosphate phosphatase [Serpentinimonas barnesii]|uniref:undecaprenyl-diphosphate phosphatase n=1 Tax=Serpentinimonas barnesii TaxID=1458427 RepID=UPI000496B7C7|nr:undecaprenyl-diphosphate phosphatase [Serpentinimonas barnesii]
MDIVLLLKAAVMGLVQGITEFLPISSTGHLILTSALLGLYGEKVRVFEVVIQVGALLAIVSVYFERLWTTARGLPRGDAVAWRFTSNLVIGCLPAVLLGVLFFDFITGVLFNPLVVASTFISGGLVILWVEARQARQPPQRIQEVDAVGWRDSLTVGLIQCLALVPGVSRSGATIIGAMAFGFSRRAATEFSFFLSIPMLVGAAGYDLFKNADLLTRADLPFFAVGLIVTWLSAWACVRWLLRYVAQHTFVPFAWYRIGFGLLVLLTAYMGWVDWTR